MQWRHSIHVRHGYSVSSSGDAQWFKNNGDEKLSPMTFLSLWQMIQQWSNIGYLSLQKTIFTKWIVISRANARATKM